MINDSEYLHKLRHSSAHLLAAAVLDLWPNTLTAIGPSIENGFYYDFEFKDSISEKDFEKIELKMKELVKSWNGFSKIEASKSEALEKVKGNPYKIELIEEIANKNESITFYKSGGFEDLCRGGHVENPSIELKAFKLLSIAGAYWRGDEKNKMLTRIYGTSFSNQKELDNYLQNLEDAKKRDHRKLGKELGLFTFSDLVGSGLPLYTQKGALVRRLLTSYVEELQVKEEYMQVWTPQIAKADLFKKSGHYDKYHEDMFKVVSNYSDEEMFLKPMNCPQHTQIYASEMRSYRDLPIRMTDFAMLYRDERPGELNGLARVRSFSQDDCHIFCREDQVNVEIDKALQMTKVVMEKFGFKYKYRLSTRDLSDQSKYLGDPKIWDKVEAWAIEIMKRNGIEYFDGPGEAAFYAPKMDLIATDALGREWQLSTIQIDYVMPERFDLKYSDKDGQEKRPIMLHRAIMGSAERFMMIVLEHFGGALPAWLSPVQVKILPISSEKHADYANSVAKELKEKNIRVEVDLANETLGNKIRKAQAEKIPYVIVLGDKEIESNQLSVRTRGNSETKNYSKQEFLSYILDKIENKSLDL